MSLETRKKIHGKTWNVLPIADEVIERVHEKALGEGQSLIADNIKYEWRLDGEQLTENDNSYEVEQSGEEVEDKIGKVRPLVIQLRVMGGRVRQ